MSIFILLSLVAVIGNEPPVAGTEAKRIDEVSQPAARALGSSAEVAILHEPVRQSDLTPALAIVMRRFDQLQERRNQIDSLKHDLETGT